MAQVWRHILRLLPVLILPASSLMADPALRDKTLVVWAAPANLTQHGGSVLTVEDRDMHFDAIVFAEGATARWMPGSDYWKRSASGQSAWEAETADASTLVQIAIVYRDKQITQYRNAREYAHYPIEEPQSFSEASMIIMIGPRHLENQMGPFAGMIDDARIYDQALSAAQLAALRPKMSSEPKPWAWWTFDDVNCQDRMKRLLGSALTGGAKISNGRLVLDGKSGGFFAARNLEALRELAVPIADDTAKANPNTQGRNTGADSALQANRSSAMLFEPTSGSWWDPSILWHDGQYYLFSMLRPQGASDANSMLMATSRDGVHWQDRGAVMTSTRTDPRVWKMFVARCGDRFIMDHGAFSKAGADNDTLCFYESKDLTHWTSIGENHPAPEFYRPEGRWDHMYILPKEEGNPTAGFWGYVVANPNQKMISEGRGMGMMESADGREWTQLPPPKVDCGRFPPISSLEIGGCERLGGKYYLIGGLANVMGQSGYSMFTMVSDSPTGPFRLDQDAWRLCGSSGYPDRWGIQYLACFARGHDETLISQYISFDKGVWLVPLKRAAVDKEGHLRMAYWPGNDAAKGPRISMSGATWQLGYPAEPKDGGPALTVDEGRVKLATLEPKQEDYADRQAMALLGTRYEPRQGVIVEGTIKLEAAGRPRPQYAGFYIEEEAGKGVAVLLQAGHPTWRKSMIGGLALEPKWTFACLDETGPGCATVTGLDVDRKHGFRLWLRNGAFELYVDDILMQTFITRNMTGRLGVIAQNVSVSFADLRMWRMD